MTTRRQRSRRALEALAREEAARVGPLPDPEVARFADRTRQQQAAERERKRSRREARQRAKEHQRLSETKDAAAAEVKRLRGRAGVSAAETASADSSYRIALAELIAFETGQPPAWAGSANEPAIDAALDEADALDRPELADGNPPAGASG